jgi:hypothetical protein
MPQTLNPKTQTLNPKTQTRNPKPTTLNPEPWVAGRWQVDDYLSRFCCGHHQGFRGQGRDPVMHLR